MSINIQVVVFILPCAQCKHVLKAIHTNGHNILVVPISCIAYAYLCVENTVVLSLVAGSVKSCLVLVKS